MHESALRLAAFLVGLAGFRLGEGIAPDHPPTVPLRPRWLANLSLGFVNGGITSVACVACFLVSASPPLGVAVLPALGLPPALRLLAEIAVLDLLTYALHRSYHVVPLLWRFHVVHHTDQDLDVSSASRFHPGEILVSSLAKLAVVAVVGVSPVGLIAFETVMLACAQFQHSNVRMPAGVERVLWLTVVPPEMHRLHHTPKLRDTNSNYGTILTLWDRLLGTLNARSRQSAEEFGAGPLPKATWLHHLLLLPFRARLCDSGRS